MKSNARHTVIVGSGIVGLAHAWAAARQGDRVTVFERSDKARGASVRNFGMFWPIGQTVENYPIALRSGALWQEFASAMNITARRCGSACIVDHDDEAAVLEEFAKLAPDLGIDCELWTRAQAEERCPGVRKGIAKAALFSPTECNVDPRQALATLPVYLAKKYGVAFHWSTAVAHVEEGKLTTASGERSLFDQIIICSGHDFETLFPLAFADAPIKVCKLQMLRTVAQPDGWSLGPMLASGLTLRHYDSFAICPSLAAVKNRIARDTPELDHYGIHVMASQNGAGEVVIGDSHHYGDAVIPFDDDADAIRIANDSEFGLNGSVFTNDPQAAYDVARRIRTGAVAQNGMKLEFTAPFGGFKKSGIGREGGDAAIWNFLELKTILVDAGVTV